VIRYINRLLIIVVLFTMSACSSTQMTGTWENQANYRPLVDDVVVFVLPGRPEIRRTAEKDLVTQLNQRKARAIPGSSLVADRTVSRTEVPWIALKSEGVRYALVISEFKRNAKPIRLRAIELPDDYLEFYDYYAHSNYQPTMQEYLTTTQHLSLEINLYDIDNRQIVMAIVSDTVKKGDLNENIHEFINEVLNHMTENGYLIADE
jgi:hypothetical protein